MFGPIKIDRFSSKRTGLKFSGKGSEFCFLVQTQKLFLAKSKIRVTRLDLSLLLPAQWLKILILKLKKLIESYCFIIIFDIQLPLYKKQYYLLKWVEWLLENLWLSWWLFSKLANKNIWFLNILKESKYEASNVWILHTGHGILLCYTMCSFIIM